MLGAILGPGWDLLGLYSLNNPEKGFKSMLKTSQPNV